MSQMQVVYYYQEKDEKDRILIKRKSEFLTQIDDPYNPGHQVWGFYRFEDKESGDLGSDTFYLSFPDSYVNKNVTVDSFLEVHYLDEPDSVIYKYNSADLIPGEKLDAQTSKVISTYSYHFDNGNF